MTERSDNPFSDVDEIEPPLSKRQRRLTWFLTGIAFLISYVLSAGPAVFVMERMDQPMLGEILQKIYAPLVFLVKAKVPVIGPGIEAYVELFR